jgi:ABC-type dipeptide/oligopeptide/nickel transport system permease subunit
MESNFEYLSNDFEQLPADAFSREEIARPQTTYLKDVWRSFRKRKTAVFGLVVVCIMIVMVLVGPMMNEFNYYTNDYDSINQAPNAVHWFGTDELGRDM